MPGVECFFYIIFLVSLFIYFYFENNWSFVKSLLETPLLKTPSSMFVQILDATLQITVNYLIWVFDGYI